MPLRSDWRLAREGFTLDTVIHLIKNTLLNPLPILPLYALSLYTDQGRTLALERPKLAKLLKNFAVLSAIRSVSAFLDKGVLNNWTSDVYDWRREIAVVTGGSDGIGARVALLLAELGLRVVVVDVQGLKYTAPPNLTFLQCDLASPKSIANVGQQIRTTIGNPTILVNNAGVARNKTLLETTAADLDLTFDVNCKAHYLLTAQFLPSMIQNNHGTIVTVASMAAYVTAPRAVAYAASKAAALAFHEGLQSELATLYNAKKVRTIAVTQNYTRTALFAGWNGGNSFTKYPLEVDTVAEGIVKAILRGRSDHLVLPSSGALAANLRGWPLWLAEIIRRDTQKLTLSWNGRQVDQPSELTSTVSLADSSTVPSVHEAKMETNIVDSDQLVEV